MPTRIAGLLLFLIGASAALPAYAQAPTPPQPPLLQRLFPQPTGLNGYEDFVMAADLIRDNKAFDEATDGNNTTLAVRRRALADPACARALALLREGLKKPIASPRTQMDETTVLPELTWFRALGRLLMVEQYVLLADGRVGAAIDSVRDGLRFAYRIQMDCMINGLVGVAIDSIVLNTLAHHLDQLSLPDCEQVIRLVNEWLDAPSPLASILMSERDLEVQILARRRNDVRGLQTLLDDTGSQEAADAQAVQSYLTQNPGAVTTLVDQSIGLLKAYYDDQFANLQLPPWQRKSPLLGNPNTLSAKLSDMLRSSVEQVLDKYTTDRVNLQLLGVHAAIHRYRWENNRLPDDLAAVKEPRLVIDPFTGKPFDYRRTGETYTLSSVGPYARSPIDQQPTSQRTPVTLPR